MLFFNKERAPPRAIATEQGVVATRSVDQVIAAQAIHILAHGRNEQECGHPATEAFQFPEIVLRL
jgi:hypothetical protein